VAVRLLTDIERNVKLTMSINQGDYSLNSKDVRLVERVILEFSKIVFWHEVVVYMSEKSLDSRIKLGIFLELLFVFLPEPFF
jgi:hypothetical protein